MLIRSFLSLVFVSAVTGACSDDTPPTDDVTTACTQLATSMCAKAACSGPFAQYPDTATCQSQRVADCVQAAKRPGTGYAASAVTSCAQQLDAAGCFDQWTVIEGAPCAFLYTGTLAEGAACQRFDQCASGSCSAAANQCGVCRPVAAESASCADRACAPHLHCVQNTCMRDHLVGEACVTEGPGASCDFPFACVSGTCQNASTGEGAKCAFASDPCDTSLGLICTVTDDPDSGAASPNVGTCQPYKIPAVGESCNAGDTACGPGVSCILTADKSDATCFLDPAEGAVCDPTGAPCLYPLSCISGKCTKPLANACP